MPNGHDPVGVQRRLLPFVQFALDDGWKVFRARAGHLTFLKSGLPVIYTGFLGFHAKARELHLSRRPADRTGGKEASDG